MYIINKKNLDAVTNIFHFQLPPVSYCIEQQRFRHEYLF